MERRRILIRLVRRRSAVAGAAVIAVIVVLAALAPYLSLRHPIEQSLRQRLLPPGGSSWLGTDHVGRDVLSRIVWGSRISLMVGVVAVAVGGVIGGATGLTAGYFGRGVDTALMRVIDVMMAFPTLLLAIIIVAVLGVGLTNLMIAIGVASVPQFARLLRGEVMKVKLQDYVEAARGLGASNARILVKHVLPNTWSALIVLVTLRVSVAILSESTLSFLGLGVPPPTPSWGTMAAEGKNFLLIAPWVSIVPGLAIMLIVLGFNLFGDGLRDALDPRLRTER
jgi:peptide/nickel transport system permease protein